MVLERSLEGQPLEFIDRRLDNHRLRWGHHPIDRLTSRWSGACLAGSYLLQIGPPNLEALRRIAAANSMTCAPQ